MPADVLWLEPVRHAASTFGVREVTYSATAFDPNWPAHGGPQSALTLAVVALALDWDADRQPMARGTLEVAEDGTTRWLSPLLRSCMVTIAVTHQSEVKAVGTFSLRRRRRSYPGGTVTLDIATRDADWAGQWVATEIEES